MKNAKINKVVKWCLILAAVVMTGSFCFNSDIIYGEVKGAVSYTHLTLPTICSV